jgi:hypothetical protein
MPGPDTYIYAAFPLSPKPLEPEPVYAYICDLCTHTPPLQFLQTDGPKKNEKKEYTALFFELSFTAYFGETD